MEIFIIVLQWFLILLGLIFIIISTIGLFKMPDIYTRQHSLALIDSIGFFSIILGLSLFSGFTLVSFKTIFLGVLCVLVSAPTCYALMQVLVQKENLINKKE
jgi:multicomponent Na+:H+ antiporter subunit G